MNMFNPVKFSKSLVLTGTLVVGVPALMYSSCVTAQTSDPARNLLVRPTGSSVSSEIRVALVIGNGSYRESPLSNPVNDARAFAQALQRAGFAVLLRENLDQRGMHTALRDFGDRLRGSSTGLFYYAGHGMQIKGRNYLIPVGGNIEREDEVAYAAVDAQSILDKMESAGNTTNIMILDACRNNPFTRSFRSVQNGLAPMDAPIGTLIAFATSPGSVASDGAGENGLYTQHLLQAMQKPGLKVEDVFKRVRAHVRKDSQGKQVPWEATSLEGDFYFTPSLSAVVQPDTGQVAVVAQPSPPVQQRINPVSGQATQTVSSPASTLGVAPGASPEPVVNANQQAAFELALWETVKNTADGAELQAYLRRYPDGVFATSARVRLNALLSTPTRPAGGAQVVAQVDTQKPAAVLSRSNAFGFTVGDRWRYQVVDKYKAEVVDNWSQKVLEILPNGDVQLEADNLRTPEGNVRKAANKSATAQSFTPHAFDLPKEFRVGYTESFKYDEKTQRADGSVYSQVWTGSFDVKGSERIKVPAGEFEAYRIERVATANGTHISGPTTYMSPVMTDLRSWSLRQVDTIWYVPSIRAFVAKETQHKVYGVRGGVDMSRVELTSFEVANAETAKR